MLFLIFRRRRTMVVHIFAQPRPPPDTHTHHKKASYGPVDSDFRPNGENFKQQLTELIVMVI